MPQPTTTHLTASTPASLTATLPAAEDISTTTNIPLYIHVRADWCPDCTRTDGVVRAALAARTAPTIFLTALITDRDAYRTPDYPYRTHPTLQLAAIPTLIRVGDGARLVEGECGDAARVRELLGVEGEA